MTGLFAKKKQAPTEETVLLVDIENGSVGCALVQLPTHPGELPKLFAETRIALPIARTLELERLLADLHGTLRKALEATGVIASRMRAHPKLTHIGTIRSAVIFIAAPWTSATALDESIAWDIEPKVKDMAQRAVTETFGDVPLSFYATSVAVTHATDHLFETAPHLLLCTVTGEVTELSVLENGQLASRATIPLGKHYFIRTLASHAGMSYPEAQSAIRLARISSTPTPIEEALYAAGTQYALSLTSTARELHTESAPHGILVVAQEPVGEWMAQMLSQQELLTQTFPEGTTVQALHTHHVAPYLAAHAPRPDIVFMIEALFITNTH